MLFCKPPIKANVLYEHPFRQCQTIKFRSLNLKKDLNILHSWMSEPRSKFWRPDGSVEEIHSAYGSILKNQDKHSFVGLLDEQLVCLIDVYRLQYSELGEQLECKYHDCGMRLLMAPYEQPIPRLSRKVMEAFMRYLFSFAAARYLYAEPDIHNTKACRLLEKCGFSFLQNIMLQTKAASLYLMTRNQFYATHRSS